MVKRNNYSFYKLILLFLIVSVSMLTACGESGLKAAESNFGETAAILNSEEEAEASDKAVSEDAGVSDKTAFEETEISDKTASEDAEISVAPELEEKEKESKIAEEEEVHSENSAAEKTAEPRRAAEETQISENSRKTENSRKEQAEVQKDTALVFGDERADIYLPLLEGKRVALFTNQTGIVGNKVNTENGTCEGAKEPSSAAADAAQSERGANSENIGQEETETDSEDKKQKEHETVSEKEGQEETETDSEDKKQKEHGTASEKEGQREDLIPFGRTADGEAVESGEHILDALLRQNVDVTAVFVPEHGFRGTDDAGSQVSDSVDERTGVPVISLYGSGSAYPSAENMDRFDTLVIDIQDVGLRYYTYYISMYYLMDACASAGKNVLILDRPNPNGFYVDGPILEDEFSSGIGILPIPVVHGMTLGELARMINGEGWLSAGTDACSLTVVPCDNYTHETKSSLIINPSPNLKDMRAIYLYASTCYFENTAFSVGRGTEFPFEAYGSPYLTPVEGFEFVFTPESMTGAMSPPFEGQDCVGKDLRDIPLEQIWEEQINLKYVIDAYRVLQEQNPGISFFGSPDGRGHYWIDYLFGTDRVRQMIEEGRSAPEIQESWKAEADDFREQRRPYILYEE